MKYYLKKDDSEHGPFSIDELKEHDIVPETLIRPEDSAEWNQACDIPEFYHLLFDTEEELIEKKTKPRKKSISLRIFIRDLLAILIINLIMRFVAVFLFNPSDDLSFSERILAVITASFYIFAIIIAIPVLLAIIIYIVKKEIKSWLVGLAWIIFAVITFLLVLSKAFILQNMY